MKNYRPITLLSIFSKIFEKLVFVRLNNFCLDHNILHVSQYGFQSGKNTESALTTFTNDVLQAFDKQEYTISTFLDFRKAFDTVNHDILLSKLTHRHTRDFA